jgi:hypothetical protein
LGSGLLCFWALAKIGCLENGNIDDIDLSFLIPLAAVSSRLSILSLAYQILINPHAIGHSQYKTSSKRPAQNDKNSSS